MEKHGSACALYVIWSICIEYAICIPNEILMKNDVYHDIFDRLLKMTLCGLSQYQWYCFGLEQVSVLLSSRFSLSGVCICTYTHTRTCAAGLMCKKK